MKFFSIATLLIQFILLGSARYYEALATQEMAKLQARPRPDIIPILTQFDHYHQLDTVLSYVAGALWIVVIIVVKLTHASERKSATLAIVLPMLASLVLTLI